jgi:putative membrane protein
MKSRQSLSSLLYTVLKGVAMGAANVIPGVSGGTIALITGIFERLIDALKSFDITAVRLLFSGKFKQFAEHIDLYFLIALFSGVGIAIITLARLFKFLFEYYPVYIWAFFFGLVLASVYYVAKTVTKWSSSAIISFIIGTAVAMTITFLKPGTEDSSFVYLLLCGVVAICSMILPGLSGSFVLLLMGNYKLVMVDAVNEMNLAVLIPVGIGAVGGLLLFSHFLSWLLKKYHNQTIAMLAGFILGSLGILWPWKESITQTFGEKVKVIGYEWHLPELNTEFFLAFLYIVLGILTIVLTEYFAEKGTKKVID